MNNLIAFYTRTGNTKKVAEMIAERLNSEIEQIVDTTKRGGLWGWLKSGYHATMKKMTEIEELNKDPSSYDLVILGSPVWNKRMTPAIRTYITNNKDKFNRIALFCSAGGRGVQEMLESMAELCEKEPIAMKGFSQKDVKENALESKIENFTQNIRKHTQ